MYDICIVGAGIIGCFMARDLSKRELSILMIDKESDPANGSTMANSAIIHAGDDPEDGTLKALLNVRGSRMYEDICRDLGTAFLRTSALVAATSPEEEVTLGMRFEKARARGIPAVMLTREEAIRKEPNLSSLVTKAMELPTTGVIRPWEVAIALAEEAVLNGVELHLEEEVTGINRHIGEPAVPGIPDDSDTGFYTVRTRACSLSDKGEHTYDARVIINCAGVFTDKIYRMVTDRNPLPFTVIPRRGEYFVIDKLKEPVVKRIIYPVPSAVGKGILATPTVDGNLLVGPNALDIDDPDGINTTYDGLAYVREKISKTVKNIPMDKVIRQFAGLRAKGNNGDFLIEEADDARHFINIACIDSPGLSSAPAISEYVIVNILGGFLPMTMKKSFIKRRPPVDLAAMPPDERAKLAAKDPSFGNIICRCEQVTEGEILDVIRRPVGARTVKGVKKRARPGMGRCQGGFCEPRVVEILARELGIPKTDVRYDSSASVLLTGETKNLPEVQP